MKNAGKTIEEKINNSKDEDIKVIIIDPEYEYKDIVKKLGGETIMMNPSNATTINPLDIEKKDI